MTFAVRGSEAGLFLLLVDFPGTEESAFGRDLVLRRVDHHRLLHRFPTTVKTKQQKIIF